MNALDIIERLGGGLTAVVIVGLALYALMMTKRVFQVQDARIEDQKLATQESREMATLVNSALTSSSQAMNGAATAMTSAREAMLAATAVMERSSR